MAQQDNNEGEWVECKYDDDYEINTVYPYPLRKKGTKRILKESVYKKGSGSIYCVLDGAQVIKAVVIAKQFIPNDNPLHKTCVLHINDDKLDNRVENLIWASPSDVLKNNRSNVVYLRELPENTVELKSIYLYHNYNGYYINYDLQKLYVFTGIKYRELNQIRNGNRMYYNLIDANGDNRCLKHNVLFKKQK